MKRKMEGRLALINMCCAGDSYFITAALLRGMQKNRYVKPHTVLNSDIPYTVLLISFNVCHFDVSHFSRVPLCPTMI